MGAWRLMALKNPHENYSCQFPIRRLKTLPFIPQIREWTRFVWSLSPWSQEVLKVMA